MDGASRTMAGADGASDKMTMDFQVSAAEFNKTRAEIAQLVLSQQKTLRSMHVVLGVFSLIFATVMVTRILYDSWRTSKLSVLLRPRKLEWLRSIHTAEVFPLALAVSVVLQMVIIIAIQTANLDRFFELNCQGVVQIALPTIFLVAFTTLVFGIETTLRALKGSVPRGRWTTLVCVIAIFGCLIVTWVPTVVWMGGDMCYGELIWIPFRYRRVIVPLISVLLVAYISLGALLVLKLRYDSNFEAEERIAASRMVYYLAFAMIEQTLIIPFFIQAYLSNMDSKFTSARVAEIALFSSGIFIAFLHLFLRVNVNRMIIKPVGVPWKSNKKAIRFRLFGPSDLEMTISEPVVKDRAYAMQDYYNNRPEKADLEYAYNAPEKATLPSDAGNTNVMGTRQSKQSIASKMEWPLPLAPLKVSGIRHSRKPSEDKRTPTYSLFPNRASTDEAPRLPATVYNPREGRKPSFDTAKRGTATSMAPSVTDVSEAYQGLLPPRPLFAQRPFHRRNSSLDSSATVQIGLRMSVAPAAMIAGNHDSLTRALMPPPLARVPTRASGESLDSPIQASAPAPLFASKPKSEPSSDASGPSGPPPAAPPPLMPSPLAVKVTMADEKEEPPKETETVPAAPALLAAPAPSVGPPSPASTRFQEDDDSEDGSSQFSAPSFESFTILNPQNSQRYLETARNKVLPPTPPKSSTDEQSSRDAKASDASSPPSGSPPRSPPRINPTAAQERTDGPRWVDLRSGTIKRSASSATNGQTDLPKQQWI